MAETDLLTLREVLGAIRRAVPEADVGSSVYRALDEFWETLVLSVEQSKRHPNGSGVPDHVPYRVARAVMHVNNHDTVKRQSSFIPRAFFSDHVSMSLVFAVVNATRREHCEDADVSAALMSVWCSIVVSTSSD